MHWTGWQYADLGFLANAAEALGELCSRFDDAKARRLLAELIWWRDNAYRIPWIPPAGDGSRYDLMMEKIDSFALKTKDEVQRVRSENKKERITPYRPSIDPQLAKLFEITLPTEADKSITNMVDWSFLDADDGQPGEPAHWVKKHIQRLELWDEDDLVHQASHTFASARITTWAVNAIKVSRISR